MTLWQKNIWQNMTHTCLCIIYKVKKSRKKNHEKGGDMKREEKMAISLHTSTSVLVSSSLGVC